MIWLLRIQISSLRRRLLARAPLGKDSSTCSEANDYSQVYKAKLIETGEFFALKRIKMDQEKDGVRLSIR